MVRYFTLLILIFAGTYAFTQSKTDTVKGKFYGENLYIFNPSVSSSEFCIKRLIVNDDTVQEQLNSNAIELDLINMGLDDKADILVIIEHSINCKPIVVNIEALLPPNPFKFSRPKIRDNTVQWYIYGVPSDYNFEVQHKKWDKWETVTEVSPLDTIRSRYYEAEVKLHSGDNEFRLYTTNLKGDEVYSRESRYRPPYLDKVELESDRVKEELIFSRQTEYRIYNENNEMMLSGYARYVDVKSLQRGKYWLKYDNRVTQFKKK